MPVLSRRRDQIGEPVQELKRREFDHAVRAGPRGRSAAAGADPVGCFVSREHVADATDAAVWAADHGEPLECEGGPGTVPQQVFEGLTIDTQLETKERDPDEKRRLKTRCSPSRACRRRPRQGLAPFVSANGACPFCLFPAFFPEGVRHVFLRENEPDPEGGQISRGE